MEMIKVSKSKPISDKFCNKMRKTITYTVCTVHVHTMYSKQVIPISHFTKNAGHLLKVHVHCTRAVNTVKVLLISQPSHFYLHV